VSEPQKARDGPFDAVMSQTKKVLGKRGPREKARGGASRENTEKSAGTNVLSEAIQCWAAISGDRTARNKKKKRKKEPNAREKETGTGGGGGGTGVVLINLLQQCSLCGAIKDLETK